ncbi:MAG: hypothetical protein A2X49_14570 [Lentisphaerae bacterium GWF2_52_8]|nr:MAG: hypothetical protein A2X49_14570 [Lentisphaerae bacterium GWF2_52_8]
MTDNSKIQSVARALKLLRFLEDGPKKLSEISAKIEIHPPGALKILRTLIEEELVSKADDNTYSLGLGCCSLVRGYLSKRPFAQAAYPIMAELCETTGQASILAVLDGLDQVNLMRISPAGGLPNELVPVKVGTAWPQATGLVLLANKAAEFLDRHLAKHPLSSLSQGPKTRAQLDKILQKVREDDYATVRVDESLKFLAMPIRNMHGFVAAALGLPLNPSIAMEVQAKSLKKAANLISRELASE